MMLRLALVGMVAALGISIPSVPEPDRWLGSAEAWATSLLAEWDTWEPSDGDEWRVAEQGHIGCAECQRARLKLLATAARPTSPGDGSTPKVETASTPENGNPSIAAAETVPSPDRTAENITFEPFCVEENFESEIDFELNRMSDGIFTPAAVSPSTVATSNASEISLPALASELGIWGELFRAALEPPVAPKPVEPTTTSRLEPDPTEASIHLRCRLRGRGRSRSCRDAGSRSARESEPKSAHNFRIRNAFRRQCEPMS